ncbi:hypothetical protein FM107_10085 [Sphingobacterium sp. JB170]|nr:hypothetical protein FM107_10085 [Sphingobacterium sp. JB170]
MLNGPISSGGDRANFKFSKTFTSISGLVNCEEDMARVAA